MKNPLLKRIPHELKQDFFKYLAIFLFLVLLIGLVSGFLITDDSFHKTYTEGFKTQKVEDGHFSFKREAPEQLLNELSEKGNINIYPYYFFEEDLKDTDKTVRVYSEKRDINLLDLMSGEMPKAQNEIALDRMFAQNNKINVGDTIILRDKELKVTGFIASPDYSCLFENNSDMMFNAINFSVAVMSEEGFNNFNSSHLTYNYAWTYPEFIEREDKSTAKQKSDDLIDVFEDVIEDYDNKIIDTAVVNAKLIFLSEAFHEINKTLVPMGMSVKSFSDSQILEQINKAVKDKNIDLSKELSDGKRDVVITSADIDKALNASKTDLDEAQNYIDNVETKVVEINDYLPRYLNQAINFTGDDMGSDKSMILMIDYIITLVIAFVFATTVSTTISSESGVIGTLRASGYKKSEIIRHYMFLPVAISLLGAVVGNILGYTVFIKPIVTIYYNSFSLASFKMLWNLDAFLLTTVVPLILMVVINLLTLIRKLKLSPLKFLRHDLSRRQKKKAFRLNTKIPFIHRFRTRIIFQSIPNYLTLFFGIFIGGVLMVFATMFVPLLQDYKHLVINDRICEYQYILTEKQNTENSQAEKYNLESLATTNEKFKEDNISIYGIQSNSKYIKANFESGKVVISNSVADKFKLKVGDTFKLKDSYNSSKTYEFSVGEIITYNSGLAIFMPNGDFIKTFNKGENDFTGYFSNEKLTDIDEDNIASVITVQDLTKLTDQMEVSMGEMMSMYSVVGVIIFMLLMFVMSKQIIEKNVNSIAMTKILGFSNGEIGGLYIVATSVVVVLSLLLSIPLIELILRVIFSSYLYTEMTGYIPYIVNPMCYVKMVVAGIVCYAVIAVVQMLKINRIPKSIALKNME